MNDRTLNLRDAELWRTLSQALGCEITGRGAQRVSGGDINTSLQVPSPQGLLFIKYNDAAAAAAMFEAEAAGLAALAAASETAWVPAPVWRGPWGHGAALVLEHLPLQSRGDERILGAALAQLHSAPTAPAFGWHQDTYLGTSRQDNTQSPNWAEFFWARRLQPQLQRAAAQGLRTDPARLEHRCAQLLSSHHPPPRLVHGDLWRGNAGFAEGRPALFDPAVYWGDREVDLALTELFGGFGAHFYEAYDTALPRPADAPGRVPLYNLYHLLNHYNLFGDSYRGACLTAMETLG